jgi:uncharacterized 2Fe-2S/4Fe-4S cluster protein (DUF4445 family)
MIRGKKSSNLMAKSIWNINECVNPCKYITMIYLDNENKNDGWIKLYNISMPPPRLGDNTADVDRLVKYIQKTIGSDDVSIPFPLVKKTPFFLSEHNYGCNVALYCIKEGWKVIDIYPSYDGMKVYAVAIDLGSSTIVIRMIDIISGESLDEVSFTYPQHEIGSDILSRIHFASEDNGIAHLQEILIREIYREIKEIQKRHNIKTSMNPVCFWMLVQTPQMTL